MIRNAFNMKPHGNGSTNKKGQHFISAFLLLALLLQRDFELKQGAKLPRLVGT